jgi:NAD(P)-dependent dehydrogenase (short-subunit alcohol dehydrogenase family)
MTAADALDAALEWAVVPSFTRLGPAARSRLFDWTPLERYDLSDHRAVITGATSGLGEAAAGRLASLGATVVIVGRDGARLESARSRIVHGSGNDRVEVVPCDLAEVDEVRAAATTIASLVDRVDSLVHNAGALLDHRVDNTDGVELTVAAQVVGPFALTSLLLPLLRAAAPGRVVTMSSGGMYTAPLTVDDLQMPADGYRGVEQYARAKRAQVTLNEMWAARVPADEVVFHALHPGWADTPGVTAALPTFARLVGPLLRTPAEGADTMVWLCADDEPAGRTGDFWLDRRPRPIHRLGRTRRSDTPERRHELWRWCVARAGIDPVVP